MQLKRALKILIIVLSLISAVFICYRAYYVIPRLTYTYDETYDGYIVENAFGDISSYTIPETYKGKNVVGIGERAFYKHQGLKEVKLEKASNLKVIGRLAFQDCKKLQYINIYYVEDIERDAFLNCSSLKVYSLSAKNIGGSAFFGCTSIDSLVLEGELNSIGSMAFAKTKIVYLDIPDTCKYLYTDCFYGMDCIDNVSIPSTVEYDCDYLDTLDFLKYK